jgi:hypothetical protein
MAPETRSVTRPNPGRRLPAALLLTALVGIGTTWFVAWRTSELWHSGGGLVIPLLAGLCVGSAVWSRRTDRLRSSLAFFAVILVTALAVAGVLMITLARWEG